MTEITLLGAGLYAAPMIDLARACGFEPSVIYDGTPEKVGQNVLGVPVVGTDDDLFATELAGRNFVIAIGNNRIRTRLFDLIRDRGGTLPALIHPTACVSESASIGAGSYIQPHAIIWSLAQIGESVIISPSTMISHHTEVGKGCMISTLTSVGSDIRIGNSVFIGMGCTIMTGIRELGDNAVIGAGSVVIRDVEPGATMVGVPARRIK